MFQIVIGLYRACYISHEERGTKKGPAITGVGLQGCGGAELGGRRELLTAGCDRSDS
jgi:hypothetical protein